MNKRILRLAFPAILNNITVPLLGLSDTTIAGHLGSASFLAAMAVGAMMLNVIFWLCGFLRMGTTGLVSQAYGAGEYAAIRSILRRSLTIALIISIFVLVLQRPLERLLFIVIAPEESVSALASSYFRICLWGAPAQLIIMVVSGWFIGMQNTVVPMAIAIGVNIINILLSVGLVFGLDCGFAGIASGTLAANWIGALAAIIWLRIRMRTVVASRVSTSETRCDERNSKTSLDRIKKSTFAINANLFLRSACIMVVTLAMTSYGSRLGENTLAANAVIMQFFLFFSYFMDGFAFAGEAIVGKAVGARDFSQLSRCVRYLLGWGAVMSAAFFVIYLFGIPTFTGLLTDSDAVRQTVGSMYWWIVALPPITVAAFLFDGIFIGMTRTQALLVTTLIATAAFFLIISLPTLSSIFPIATDAISWSCESKVFRHPTLTNTLLWLAFETYLLLRGLLLAIAYYTRNH